MISIKWNIGGKTKASYLLVCVFVVINLSALKLFKVTLGFGFVKVGKNQRVLYLDNLLIMVLNSIFTNSPIYSFLWELYEINIKVLLTRLKPLTKCSL